MLSIALTAVAAGIALVVYALVNQESAPTPPAAVGRIEPAHPRNPGADRPPGPSSTPAAPRSRSQRPLGPSRPVHLRIPAIGVNTRVNKIGLTPNGHLAVPQPGPHLNQAAWFKNSPTPGQPGPSIIEGHVDSVQGISVFFRLGAIRPHDLIHVRRADGIRLTFTVDGVRDYKKKHFPTRKVYGSTDAGRPELRLITCSDFVQAIHHHIGNEVVYSHLTHIEGRHRS
ncbi:MAG: class F sortase [Marmoricola sp.]